MERIKKYRSFYMGLAAVWIFVFHYFPYPTGNSFFTRSYSFIHATGFTGADIFLFLSGYGLVNSLSKKPIQSFRNYLFYAGRRLLRVYPAYLIVTVVSGIYYRWSLWEYICKLTFVEQFFIEPMNYMWFIPCILLFSLLLPMYYYFFKKAKYKVMLTGILSILWIVLLFVTPSLGFENMTYRVPIFLIGILCGYYAISGTKAYIQDYLVLALMFIIGLTLQAGIYFWGFKLSNMLNNILIVPAILFFSSVIFDTFKKAPFGLRKYFLHPIQKVFIWIGSISLEVYLLQYLAYDPGFDKLHSVLHLPDVLTLDIGKSFILLAMTLLFSFILHYGIEIPTKMIQNLPSIKSSKNAQK